MKIREYTQITLVFDKSEYRKFDFIMHKNDLIMYRGDTYIACEFIVTDENYIIKLELYRRACNFYEIDMNDNINKVSDYNLNCLRR